MKLPLGWRHPAPTRPGPAPMDHVATGRQSASFAWPDFVVAVVVVYANAWGMSPATLMTPMPAASARQSAFPKQHNEKHFPVPDCVLTILLHFFFFRCVFIFFSVLLLITDCYMQAAPANAAPHRPTLSINLTKIHMMSLTFFCCFFFMRRQRRRRQSASMNLSLTHTHACTHT